MRNSYRVIGLMSGTSMDGVDIACIEFGLNQNKWEHKIICGETFPYSEMWRVRLSQLSKQSIEIFPKTHAFYGKYLGQLVKNFVQKNQLEPDFVASHGHTIFHQPAAGFTAQIGDGAAISAGCGLPVVCDFRSMDVALGGQGAPLVPIGDQLLFPEFDACLNLGGISNISYLQNQQIRAFDISPCNIVLNRVARWLGQPYDDKGRIAASAELDPIMLEALNKLPYYQETGAKSLGREWINDSFWPIVKGFQDTSEAEKMATLATHIGLQIGSVIEKLDLKKVLVTGGGAFNEFLINQIQTHAGIELTIPTSELVNFKEALIFAFLGVLRIRNEENVLASVTGAKHNQVAGALYGNFASII